MKPMSAFRFFCLTRFGKPVEDRAVYSAIRSGKFRSIIEIGLGDGSRAEKLIQVANKFAVTGTIRYTGVDLFEAREEAQSKLSYREMHKRLSNMEAKVQLVPGDLASAITRIANSHVRTDLILISAGHDAEALAESWMYFPRMLHAGSTVLIQRLSGQKFQSLSRLEIEKLATGGDRESVAKAA